ncbi:MAG: ribosome assembly factor SBDS [Nitrososphaeria archaeon]|nr:ribosome assembly factor SBDS [Nitrososphaeria archaeon]
MSSKFTCVRLTIDGERFELLVRPDQALNYKMGKQIELSQIVGIEEIFSDATKGLRVSEEKLQKFFRTTDFYKIAEIILKKGELQLTLEQRRKLIEEKKKAIISILSKNFVDPRTNTPHPPTRYEQALEEAHVSIDPFKSPEEQLQNIVDALRPILPLKSQNLILKINIPSKYSSKSIGLLKSFGKFLKEQWLPDGSYIVELEIPVGLHSSLVEKVGSLTKGEAEITIVARK